MSIIVIIITYGYSKFISSYNSIVIQFNSFHTNPVDSLCSYGSTQPCDCSCDLIFKTVSYTVWIHVRVIARVPHMVWHMLMSLVCVPLIHKQ